MSTDIDELKPFKAGFSVPRPVEQLSEIEKQKKLDAAIQASFAIEGMFWMAWVLIVIVVAPVVSAIAWFFYN